MLDRRVSEVLILSAREVHKDESNFFQRAVSRMQKKELAFWVSPGDAQFWLDEEHYLQYRTLKVQLVQLEQEQKRH